MARKKTTQGGLRSKVQINPDTLPEVEIPQAPREVVIANIETVPLHQVMSELKDVLGWSSDGDEGKAKATNLLEYARMFKDHSQAISTLLSKIVYTIKNERLWVLIADENGYGDATDPNTEANFWSDAHMDMKEVSFLYNFERELAPVLNSVGIDASEFLAETHVEGVQAASRVAKEFKRQIADIERQNPGSDGWGDEETRKGIREKLLAYKGLPVTKVRAMQRTQRGEPDPTGIDVSVIVTLVDGKADVSLECHMNRQEAEAWRNNQYYFRYYFGSDRSRRIDRDTICEAVERLEANTPSDLTTYRARVVEQSRPLARPEDEDELTDDELPPVMFRNVAAA